MFWPHGWLMLKRRRELPFFALLPVVSMCLALTDLFSNGKGCKLTLKSYLHEVKTVDTFWVSQSLLSLEIISDLQEVVLNSHVHGTDNVSLGHPPFTPNPFLCFWTQLKCHLSLDHDQLSMSHSLCLSHALILCLMMIFFSGNKDISYFLFPLNILHRWKQMDEVYLLF